MIMETSTVINTGGNEIKPTPVNPSAEVLNKKWKIILGLSLSILVGLIIAIVSIGVWTNWTFIIDKSDQVTQSPTMPPTMPPTLPPAPTLAPTTEPFIDICLGTAQSAALGKAFIYFENTYTLENTKSMLSIAANGNIVIYSFRSNLDGTYVTFDVAGRPSKSCIRLQSSKLGPISSLGTVIDGPTPLSIEPLAFNQQTITPLPQPTAAPSSAPTAATY